MRTEPVSFFSDGLRLSGAFMVPDDDGSDRRPLVIPCSGFTGLMEIHPARFARSLTAAGFRCFAFDYRGFGDSEGERGRVVLEEQVRDIIHAVAYAAADDRTDDRKLVLLGWGMGAGLVLDAARWLPGIAGVIAANGFYEGARVQLAHRGEDGMRAFVDTVRLERIERARSGRARRADPFALYPLDASSRAYVDETLRGFAKYDAEQYSFELADSLLRWRPEVFAATMRIPLLVAHGDRNELHPADEARSLHESYAGPKELYWIRDAGHTDFMHDEDPRYKALAARVIDFARDVTSG